jgi:hypothetical protein
VYNVGSNVNVLHAVIWVAQAEQVSSTAVFACFPKADYMDYDIAA